MNVEDLIRSDYLHDDAPHIIVVVEETSTVFGGVSVQVPHESPVLLVFEGATVSQVVIDVRITTDNDIRITSDEDIRVTA